MACGSTAGTPYLFILLNLVKSYPGGFHASPIIMMSQNRQSKICRDRRNQLDLQDNLLAEQESTETLKPGGNLCEHVGVEMKGEKKHRGLKRATQPEGRKL